MADIITAQFGEPGALRFGMTTRQRRVLAFIKSRIAETGAWPTHQEIGEAADIKARLGVEYTVDRILALGAVPPPTVLGER